jgi:23S rRNA (uracil1939-C5)-methyltransferase
LQVKIESIAFGGSGVAREEGKVIFVKGGVPQDVLDVRIIKDKGSYAEAIIESVVAPSPERAEPPCEVFGTCGGCQLQNMGYEAQLREKENILKDALRRTGGFDDLPVEPIFPSGSEYAYRTRVRLAAWFYAGRWHVGYNIGGTRRKVGITSCPISDGPVNGAIGRIASVLSSFDRPEFPLEFVQISSDGREAYITLVARSGKQPGALSVLAKHLGRFPETENVSIRGKSEAEFEFGLAGMKFLANPSVFTQSNPGVNEAIVRTVLEWAAPAEGLKVLDLYSGIGNFSVPLAKTASNVVSVEINRFSSALARKNAGINGIGNISFVTAPSGEAINELLGKGETFDIVVLDPPREGAKEILEGVASLSSGKIIYVSCDPVTLSRDLKRLKELGWSPRRVKPFDMFPQTYHVESVTLLSRLSGED